jgi:hypothetical protein
MPHESMNLVTVRRCLQVQMGRRALSTTKHVELYLVHCTTRWSLEVFRLNLSQRYQISQTQLFYFAGSVLGFGREQLPP